MPGILAATWLAACGGGEPRETPGSREAASAAPAEVVVESGPVEGPRVVVLGFDGVDPDWVEEWKDELPHLSRFIEEGRLRRLGTTTPPQSPVAWSSFATSRNPGAHGIFDFIGRDPRTYLPTLGTNIYEPPTFDLTGRVERPARASTPRQGDSFWKSAAEAGVRVKVLSMPYSFPPDDLGTRGRMLSGLGTPDLRLTNSTFFLFGSDVTEQEDAADVAGGDIVRLRSEEGGYVGRVEGPKGLTGRREAIDLHFRVLPDGSGVHVQGGGLELDAPLGAFSDFAAITFPVSNFLEARALVRFYVLRADEVLRVYMTPLMLHPEAPYLEFSYPARFARDLAEVYGAYKTIGWVHDTAALQAEKVPERLFVEDMEQIFRKRLEMTLGELDRRDANLFVSVFTATDRAAHMFMRLMDRGHPRYDPALAAEYGDVVRRTYRWMDEAIGAVMERLGPEDTFIALSDHGFHSFRRGFNTNTWLVENGYLVLRDGVAPGPDASLLRGAADWRRTRAYAMGTGQIYINLQGRERDGIVAPADYGSLCRELASGLEAVVDPATGKRVFEKVHLRDEVFHGTFRETRAPDLQLAFAEGYQSSRATSLGGIPEGLLSDNARKWSGDHAASEAGDTRGFLVVSHGTVQGEPHIVDLAPTILSLLGVDVPPAYEGRDLLGGGS